MDFQGRYEIQEILTDGEARTFKALQTSTGRSVLLHQLWVERTPPNQPDLASLVFGFLRHATADEMKILVDMGEEDGRVFVVTEDLPVFQDLRQWLQSRTGTPEAAGKTGVPKSAASRDAGPSRASGGLPTQAKQKSLTSPVGTTKPFTPTKVAKPPVATPPPSKAKDEAGEFTRVFFGKDEPKSPPARPVSSPPAKPGAPSVSKVEKPPESQPPAGFEMAFEPPNRSVAAPCRRQSRNLFRLLPLRRVNKVGRRENLRASSLLQRSRRGCRPALRPPPGQRARLPWPLRNPLNPKGLGNSRSSSGLRR
jgi:hypothetical protein